MMRLARPAASASSDAWRMRSPRTAPSCRRNATPNSRAHPAKNAWLSSGAQWSSTTPTPERTAAASAWRTSCACSAAAPSGPSSAARRVFTTPGTGALANTATRTASGRGAVDVIAACEAARIGAQRVGEAQAPHEEDGAQRPVLFPAAPRGHHALGEAERRRDALQHLGEGDVLHERDLGEAAGALEYRAANEHRLVPGGDAAHARACVHEERHGNEERIGSRDRHVEASPRARGALEARQDRGGCIRRKDGVRLEEDDHVAPP